MKQIIYQSQTGRLYKLITDKEKLSLLLCLLEHPTLDDLRHEFNWDLRIELERIIDLPNGD